MRHDFLDRYSRLKSPIHRLPAAGKLAGTVALVLGIVLLPPGRWGAFAGIAIFLIVIAMLSRVPARFLLRRMMFLEPFVLLIAATALMQPDGWRLFLWLAIKSTLSLLAMLLLSSTTPFSELLGVLRRARVPSLLITTLALMYRYIFVLMDESQRMRRARQSRTFSGGRAHAWRALAGVVGQLFVRASERAERIYAAMCARGWR